MERKFKDNNINGQDQKPICIGSDAKEKASKKRSNKPH